MDLLFNELIYYNLFLFIKYEARCLWILKSVLSIIKVRRYLPVVL